MLFDFALSASIDSSHLALVAINHLLDSQPFELVGVEFVLRGVDEVVVEIMSSLLRLAGLRALLTLCFLC